MRFLYPHYLKLLFLLLALFPLWLAYQRSKNKTRKTLGDSRALKRISHISSRARDWGKYLILNLVMGAMIFALAHPQLIQGKMVPQPGKLDIVFLLDISPSMRAGDIEPTRLERALQVIGAFAHKKPAEDRIGLVSFSSGSLVLSYLTEDASNILFYLDYLKRDTTLSPGTNIGRALNNGLTIVSKDLETNPAAAQNKKVFILLSDGEDHGEGLASAIANVKRRNIKIHTIGIGSKEGGPIPIAWNEGKVVFLEDANGNRVITHLDEKTLRQIAEEAGGKFYRSFTGHELERAFAEIVLQEREIQGFKQVVEYYDLYHELLLGALGMFLVAMLL
jgi:Ca-activated chloride channel family protein